MGSELGVLKQEIEEYTCKSVGYLGNPKVFGAQERKGSGVFEIAS